MKKINVKLLVNTAYQGPRKEGDVIAVPEDFANRWVKNKIAELVDGVVDEPVEAVEENAVVDENGSLEQLSAKELYALCKDKGIDAEAKKSKEYYLEKLAAVEE